MLIFLTKKKQWIYVNLLAALECEMLKLNPRTQMDIQNISKVNKDIKGKLTIYYTKKT